MPTVVETAGASNANSFLSLAEATTLLDERSYGSAWAAESDDDVKNRAIITATRVLNALCWEGAAVTSTQRLAWPRSGLLSRNGFALSTSAIPEDLKIATAELALMLLSSDTTVETDPSIQGITKIKAGSVELQFKDSITLRDIPENVRRLIPEDWLCPAEADPVVFRAV